MTTINLDQKMAHKTIKVRARSCSECGNKSEWIEKRFFVGCHFSKLSFLTTNKKLKIISKLEECQKIIYTIDGSEPTIENGLICENDCLPFGCSGVKARIICTKTKAMGEIEELKMKIENIFVLGLGDKAFGFDDNKVLGAIGIGNYSILGVENKAFIFGDKVINIRG